jgi:hypothetical protein
VPAFVESLRVELASQPAATSDTTLVTLVVEPCDTATTHVLVTVADVASGRGSARDIGLEDVAVDARPRALALAVAELVRGTQPPPPSVAAPPVIEAQAPPPAAADATLLEIDGNGLLGLFPSRETHLWGGRLSVAGRFPRWSAGLYAEGLAGERGFADGRVAVQSFGVGAFAGPRWTRGRASVSPGLAATVAWARVVGHADAPDVIEGSGSGPTASVRARVAGALFAGHALSLSAFVEAGYVVRAFDATVDGARAAGVSGPTILFGLGFAFGS